MKKYIVIEIGCIECGVSTKIKGIYNTEKEANMVCDNCENSREGGQSNAEVFEINIK